MRQQSSLCSGFMWRVVIQCPPSWATQTPQTIYCGMLNSYWTSVLLVELKSTSSSQHWFHSPSQLSGHPAIQAAGQPFFLFLFWEHFRWVFGCEWALGMRFEEDYQGPESCLEASCAFQQNCHFPGCIRLWNIWCVTLSLPFLSLCLSHSLSGSDIEKHGCRAWRRYLGLLLPALHSLALQWYELFLVCVAMTSSPLQFCRLSCASFTMTSYLLVLNCEKRVAGCCWPNYSCCWDFHLASTAAYSMLFSAVQRPRFPWLAMLWYRLIKVWYYKA